jgi:2-methylisocitrate lyase-like PEP mutase family enzyme
MAERERLTTRFKRRLTEPELLLIPGGFSPLAGRMVEAAGLEAFFLAGSQVTAYIYAWPDVGLMAREEMTQAAQRVASACTIPVFVDADTGYGNALNVYHAVQGYVRSGAAGLHLEDQVAPKRSGTTAGRQCISQEEAIGKLRAAVAARQELDPDFVICARCDLIGAEGGSFEAAVERCIAYVEDAKADFIWLNNVQSIDELAIAAQRIPGPVMPTYGGPPPGPSLDQLQSFGIAAAIFPGMTSNSGLQATWDLLNDLKERGQAALDERREAAPAGKWGRVRFSSFVQMDQARIQEIEDRFLPPERRRDYDGTFGHFAPPQN